MRTGRPSQAGIFYSRDSIRSSVVWYPSPLEGIASSSSTEMEDICTFRSHPPSPQILLKFHLCGFHGHIYFSCLKQKGNKKEELEQKKEVSSCDGFWLQLMLHVPIHQFCCVFSYCAAFCLLAAALPGLSGWGMLLSSSCCNPSVDNFVIKKLRNSSLQPHFLDSGLFESGFPLMKTVATLTTPHPCFFLTFLLVQLCFQAIWPKRPL